jgi:cell division protein FtsI/penicillin-binding protein 2
MDASLRIRLAFLGFLFFAGLIIVRLFYWQIISADELAIAAEKQRLSFWEIPAARGEILASDGFPLASNQEGFLIFASLPELKEKSVSIAQKLASLLVDDEIKVSVSEATSSPNKQSLVEFKENEIKERLERPGLIWTPIQHKISRETREKIENLTLEGIGFEEEPRRAYPEGTASAYLLGFVGSDASGKEQGYFGLEGFYDLELRGRPGLVRREKDAAGKPILVGVSKEEEKRDGRSLLSTIDRTVQFICERNLGKGLERYGAIRGSVLVMDPNDGAVLGMVSLPTYDPRAFSEFEEEIFPNPAIAASYEPGSAFKVLVMASAINEGVVEPETRCTTCNGPRQIADYLINTWNDQYYPNSTVTEILIHSDNVGMVFISEKLGIEKLYQYLEDFGFGRLTEIDLQEEDTPLLRPEKEWGQIDLATASFGQGIAVTRIQMLRAVAAIANGGHLVRPYLIKGLIDQGNLTEIKPTEKKMVFKPLTAKIVTQMMIEAVDKGEAKWAKPEGFKIAGKTGTAQIPVAGHYDEEKTIASFVGFAPVDQPRFVMLVTLREPSSSPWGSETAAPLWFDIAKELFTYYGIAPD